MYQPKMKTALIRKLYFFAKKKGKPMTKTLDAILEEYLANEPEPPPYEEKPWWREDK